MGYECVSLAWHSGGGALAAGSTEGHLVVLNADAGAHVATLRVCGSPLNCLAYNSGKCSTGNFCEIFNISILKYLIVLF